MAKNTHAQEVATGTSDSYTAAEAQGQPMVITRPILGEVDRATIVEAYTAKGKAIGEPAEKVRDGELLDQEVIEPDEDDDTEEESSPVTADGGDSIQSSQSESSESSRPNQSHPQPAPTTDSHLSQTPADNSDARSTVGDTPVTEPQPSGKGRQTPPTVAKKTAAKKAAPAKQTGARATSLSSDDGFGDF